MADKFLLYVEKASSFASNIDPLFGIVTAVTRLLRKGLGAEEEHPFEEDFSKIHNKLESIYMENEKIQKQIEIGGVHQNYGNYEEYIKKQYAACNTMIKRIKEDPASADRHVEDFKNEYEMLELDSGLNAYYLGVIGKSMFGKPLLKVYLEDCNKTREVMELRCYRLIYLFNIGLTSHLAYTSIIQADEDGMRKKWALRVKEIRTAMEEALSQCEQN